MGRENDSRREFLKRGAAGVAAMTILPSAVSVAGQDAAAKEQAEAPKQKVVHRTLGKTGIKLPVVSMGARLRETQQNRAALDAGIVHIATANT